MNQTSRTDEPYEGDDGLNQSPNALSNDLTTNQDLNGIANSRTRRSSEDETRDDSGHTITEVDPPTPEPDRVKGTQQNLAVAYGDRASGQSPGVKQTSLGTAQVLGDDLRQGGDGADASFVTKDGGSPLQRVKRTLVTFGKFVGPGFMVSVAYSKHIQSALRCACSPRALLHCLLALFPRPKGSDG
jgi:metal iron transporter